MYNRTDIIHNLESCLAIQCDDCIQEHASHYPLDCEAYDSFVRSAVELLRAQEPRVLTLEEVLSFGAIYMDEPSNPTCLIMLYCYKVERDYRYIFVDSDGDKIPYPSKEFNKTWRCWSARPTDEQREAVKWEN